jgi:DNA polymerase-3 subunit beta
MKIILDRSELLRVLEMQISDTSRTLSDLSGRIFISAKSKNHFQIQSSTGEQELVAGLSVNVLAPGDCYVNYKIVYEVIKEISAAEVALEVDKSNQRLIVSAGRSKYRINLQPTDYFSPIKKDKGKESYSFRAKDLLSAIDHTLIAAKSDSSSDFNKLIFSPSTQDKNWLEVVGTDGIRLSHYVLDGVRLAGQLEHFCLSFKSVNILRDFCKKHGEEDTVKLTNYENAVTFDSDFASLTCLKTSSNFPDYRALVSKNFAHNLEISADELTKALKRLLFISGISKAIKFSVNRDKLLISSKNNEIGEGEEELEIRSALDNFTIVFNGGYLMDFAKLASTRSSITIFVNSSLEASKMTYSDNEKYQYILMPIDDSI